VTGVQTCALPIYQYVKSIKTDCDCDTLLVAVKQEGAACHTGAYSCFFNDIL